MKTKFLNKKNLQRLGAVLLTLLLIIIGLKAANKILRNNESNFKYDPFFKNKTDYDVFFMGSSHVLNGIFPMQLWNDYGITSYNWGNPSLGVVGNFITLQLLLPIKRPNIIVLDVYKPNGDLEKSKVGFLHKAYDIFPVSPKKLYYMNDIAKSRDDVSMSELIVPFSLYHSRWSNRETRVSSLFKKEQNVEMGAESRINVAVPKKEISIPKTSYNDVTKVPYLEKFIIYCKKKNIPLVLVFLPYPATQSQLRWANTSEIIAKKYDVPFINFHDMNVVDYDIDCYDSNSHLNPSGARKVSDYLGSYLVKEYQLEDHRKNSKYSKKWNTWYEEYKSLLVRNIQKQNNLKNVLMLLNNSNFKAKVYFSDRYKTDSVEKKLLKQISNTCQVKTRSYKKNDNLDAIVEVYDINSGKLVNKSAFYKNNSGALVKFDRNKTQNDIKKAQEQYKKLARFDIKNSGNPANAIEIIKSSSLSNFKIPSWLTNTSGIGQTLEATEGNLDITLKCINDGNLEIKCRGRDWRDSRGVRIPMKINFTKLTVNGKTVLDKKTTIWHDKPFNYEIPVKDGEIITLHAEWEPYTE